MYATYFKRVINTSPKEKTLKEICIADVYLLPKLACFASCQIFPIRVYLFPNKADKHDKAETLNLGSILLRAGFGVIYERTKWSGMKLEEYEKVMVISGLGTRGQASCLLMERVEKIEGVLLGR